MKNLEILKTNKSNYETLYAKEEAFLRYPADWLIRFHNMFLKKQFPNGGKSLDYGCGSGNNSVLLHQKGYEIHGVDVAPSFKNLVSKNLELHNISSSELMDNFKEISPETVSLPYEDETFDFIVSNQVLYYLPTEEHIKAVSVELNRILKPGGIVFFTMMGPKNYYITDHSKAVINDQIHHVKVETPDHRLEGVTELIYLVNDEEHCKNLFDIFDPLTVGYFDQSMFDLKSNFHWIYVGQKK